MRTYSIVSFIDFEFRSLQYAKELDLPDWENFEAKKTNDAVNVFTTIIH